MKNILTAEEAEKTANAVLHTTPPVEESTGVETPPALPSGKEYFLMYPDNVAGHYHEGRYFVNIDGSQHECKIQNGVAKTTLLAVKELLLRAGFIFMYEKEILQ